MEREFTCIDCGVNGCKSLDGAHPAFCPTDDIDADEREWLIGLLNEEENRRIVKAASMSAHVAHDKMMSHLEETILFARALGAQKIGIASCISLASEARAAAAVFRAHGFEVVGAICKIASVTYGDIDMEVQNRTSETVICNPIYQAKVLNDAHADLDVIMGLCAGHDTLFLKYAKAPCTFLTSKDFKFDHCAIRALRLDDESGELARLLGRD